MGEDLAPYDPAPSVMSLETRSSTEMKRYTISRMVKTSKTGISRTKGATKITPTNPLGATLMDKETANSRGTTISTNGTKDHSSQTTPSRPQQSRHYNGNGGGFNRPSFQTGDQGKTLNYQGMELQKLEMLETLIIKSMEEMSKSALEQSKRIDAIGSNFEQRMVGWDEKLDKIASKVKSLEGKIADVATSMKPFGKGFYQGNPSKIPKTFSNLLMGIKEVVDNLEVWDVTSKSP